MTVWLSSLNLTFLCSHQARNLELVALARMLSGLRVPEVRRPSAMAWAIAPAPTNPIFTWRLISISAVVTDLRDVSRVVVRSADNW